MGIINSGIAAVSAVIGALIVLALDKGCIHNPFPF